MDDYEKKIEEQIKLLLGCPICGKKPYLGTLGSHIEIHCCVGMTEPKSDYLERGEMRGNWLVDECMFTPEIEEKVFKLVSAKWNTRTGETVRDE